MICNDYGSELQAKCQMLVCEHEHDITLSYLINYCKSALQKHWSWNKLTPRLPKYMQKKPPYQESPFLEGRIYFHHVSAWWFTSSTSSWSHEAGPGLTITFSFSKSNTIGCNHTSTLFSTWTLLCQVFEDSTSDVVHPHIRDEWTSNSMTCTRPSKVEISQSSA